MRRAARRDKQEPSIIAALRAAGAAVYQVNGDGAPDLMVSVRGRLELLEVKDHDLGVATRAPHRGKGNELEGRMAWLTPAQVKWWTAWLAAGGRRPHIVLDAAEALAAIGLTDRTPGELITDSIAVLLQRKPRC